ncbi:membrane protein [Yersinia frederiksenii]|nr:membrane protein [Yersinia frederiksenii]
MTSHNSRPQPEVDPPILNRVSTTPTIRTNSLYSLPLTFYFWQVFGLAISGLLFLWLSRHEQLDWLITQYWFDPIGQNFPLEHNYWLDLLNHRLLKMAIISASAISLLWGIYHRNGRLVTSMLLLGVGPLVIGILRALLPLGFGAIWREIPELCAIRRGSHRGRSRPLFSGWTCL